MAAALPYERKSLLVRCYEKEGEGEGISPSLLVWLLLSRKEQASWQTHTWKCGPVYWWWGAPISREKFCSSDLQFKVQKYSRLGTGRRPGILQDEKSVNHGPSKTSPCTSNPSQRSLSRSRVRTVAWQIKAHYQQFWRLRRSSSKTSKNAHKRMCFSSWTEDTKKSNDLPLPRLRFLSALGRELCVLTACAIWQPRCCCNYT